MRQFCVALALITTCASGALFAQTPAPSQAGGGQSTGSAGKSPTASAQPEQFVQTFFLSHAVAQELQQTVAQLAATMPGTRPVITMNRSTNSLTIRGTENALRVLQQVIKELDVPPTAQAPVAQGQAPAAPQQQKGLPGLPTLPATTNIQLELTITDTLNGTPTTKTVSMVILNGSSGMIRTAGATNDHFLNVDAVATAYQSGLIGVRLSFEFTPPPSANAEGRRTVQAPRLNESLTVMVTDGKPLVISQSADAASDRTVTASITARVLKF